MRMYAMRACVPGPRRLPSSDLISSAIAEVRKKRVGFQQFEGKLVIVTGGGSGIDAVTARRFRDEGAAVVLTGRTREKLTKVVDQFDQERSLDPCFRRDQTRRATRPPVLMKVRDRLTTSPVQ